MQIAEGCVRDILSSVDRDRELAACVETDEFNTSSDFLFTQGVAICTLVAAHNYRTGQGLLAHCSSTSRLQEGAVVGEDYPGVTIFDTALRAVPDLGPRSATEIMIAGACNQWYGEFEKNEVSRRRAEAKATWLGAKTVYIDWVNQPETVLSAYLDCESGLLTLQRIHSPLTESID